VLVGLAVDPAERVVRFIDEHHVVQTLCF
jgi:hypothetical protein